MQGSTWLAWSKGRDRRLFDALLLFLVLIGAFLVRSSVAEPATAWLLIYQPGDFPTLGDLVGFLANLRVAIPPVIATLEILDFQLTGSTSFVSVFLYRLALILVYVASLTLAFSSSGRLVVSFGLSLVFLWGTVIVHPGNPQVYDVLYPLFVLLFLLCLGRATRGGGGVRRQLAWCAAAGGLLSMAELARPFVWLMLPVVLIGAVAALRHLPRRCLIAFLAPLVLLSGAWHLHLAVNHGQLTWSNHSGNNLYRTWRWRGVRKPELVAEPDAPLRPGRWRNVDTEEHHENSQRLQAAVLRFIVTHPEASLRWGLQRVVAILSAPTAINQHEPQHPGLPVYRVLAVLAGCAVLVGGIRLLVVTLRAGRGALDVLGDPEHILIGIALMTLFFSAMGGMFEEARFLVSLLPMFAALPRVRGVGSPPVSSGSGGCGERLESR